MSWKNLKLGKKILLGIGLVLLLMAVVGVWSWRGIDGIVSNASELASGNKLVGILLQREVDHLNWAGDVNKLLTDDHVTELHVETDHRKCGFGKWYYREGRKEAEKLIPALKPVLDSIEEPHRLLHESAARIGKVYRQADEHLPAVLAMGETDHLAWAAQVQKAILNRNQSTGVQLDHTRCNFGKLLYGDTGRQIADSNPVFAKMMEEIRTPHQSLHQSAEKIEQALAKGNFDQALQIFRLKLNPRCKKPES